jgi:cellulose synthase/poly-beta-1,6-N-acetylglucosamine synthase-like glycosyltransferase
MFLFILFFIAYSILILFFWRSWNSIPAPLLATDSPKHTTAISVIVPARNEEEHIGNLLRALESQTYRRHLFEIIVIDDHSTDNTAEIVLQFPGVKLLQLKEDKINSYKKKAIEAGIAAASNELIVTTDADCIPPAEWLQSIVSFREETNAGFIVAPVSFNCNSKLVEVFQAMDFMVLQGITGASVYKKTLSMCNGANLAYEKKLFAEVGGFSGIDHIASGDDMLLMHKIAKKFPERFFYLKAKDAIVSTRPMPTWKKFLNQRIRWASKATYYDDKKIIGVLLLVYLFNFSFLILLLAGFWNSVYWIFFLIGWMVKTLVELPFFYSVSTFFDKQWAVKFFFIFQPLHIFYTIFSGLLGQFGKYEWKGRKVS